MHKIVDLHMHTEASDGTMSPLEIVEEVIQKSVAMFSVTDHDSIDSIDEVQKLSNQYDLLFIPGVEISVACQEIELHILTYGIRTDDVALKEILQKNIDIRNAHNDAIIQYACEQYPQITMDSYENYFDDPKRGGWKAVNYLLDMEIVTDLYDFFRFLDKMGKPLIFQPYNQVIPMLKALGYTLVLAHPPAYHQGMRLERAFLDELCTLGIQGIECYSPYYKSEEDQNYYLEYCQVNNLVITSGSDYHGAFIGTRKMAVPETKLDQVSFERLAQLSWR